MLRFRARATSSAPALVISAAAAVLTHAAPAQAAAQPVTKILTVVEENHSAAEMRSQMPYLAGLGARYGQATGYVGIRHPSEPNYLAIAGGSTFGVTDDGDPSANAVSGQSVFGQAAAAGATSGTYSEAMPGRCALTGNTDRGYAVKHNPQAYFTDERAHCRATNTSTARFQADARSNALPDVGFLIPDKCDDAHDCDLGTADAYLRAQLPAVLSSSDFTSGRLAVVITADEDDRSAGNGVYTVVLQAGLSGRTVRTHLTHYSLCRMISQVVGAPGLRSAASAPDMAAAFGLDVGPATGSRPMPSPTPTPTPTPTPIPTPTSSPTPEPTSTSSRAGTPLRVSEHSDRSSARAVPTDGSLVVSGKVYFFVPDTATTRARFRIDSAAPVTEFLSPFDAMRTGRAPAHRANALDTTVMRNGEHRIVVQGLVPELSTTTYTFTVDN